MTDFGSRWIIGRSVGESVFCMQLGADLVQQGGVGGEVRVLDGMAMWYRMVASVDRSPTAWLTGRACW
jgi:hypothetical protein